MMRDRVTVAYRGAGYELGSGKDYYGLWAAGTSRAEPLERWPRTPDGWIGAWTRFTAVEMPGTITAAGRGSRSSRMYAGTTAAEDATAAEGATAVLPRAPEAETPRAGAEALPQPDDAQEPQAAHMAQEPQEMPDAWVVAKPHEAPGAWVVPKPHETPDAWGAEEVLDAQDQPEDQPRPDAERPVSEPVIDGTFAQPLVAVRSRRRIPALLAPALLTAGVILGVVGLFPSYYQGSSVASLPPLLVTHVADLAGWTIAAVLVALGGARKRAGALLAVGLSAVTIGLLLTDLFNATTAHIGLGAGTWLGLAGWLLCTIGGALALVLSAPGRPGRPRGLDLARVAVLGLAAIAAAVTFAPSWDSYLLRFANGQTSTVTAGNAFANPGLVITANVVVMVLFALVVLVASLWRPIFLGAMLLAGAVLPMAAQAVSALVQVSEPTSPAQFGISQSQAALAGLTITNGVTAWFWVFSMMVVILVASFAWMLITPHPVPPAAESAVSAVSAESAVSAAEVP